MLQFCSLYPHTPEINCIIKLGECTRVILPRLRIHPSRVNARENTPHYLPGIGGFKISKNRRIYPPKFSVKYTVVSHNCSRRFHFIHFWGALAKTEIPLPLNMSHSSPVDSVSPVWLEWTTKRGMSFWRMVGF